MQAYNIPIAQFCFNLTLEEGLSLHLMEETNKMRKQIIQKRKSSQKLITYAVIIPKIKILLIKGHIKTNYTKEEIQQDCRQPSNKQKIPSLTPLSFQFKQKSEAIVTISTSDLYPCHLRFIKVNKKSEQCYPIYINKEAHTMVGVNYTSDPTNNFGDWLGLLIAEQIRFNTLRIYNQTFICLENKKASQIASGLYEQFNPIYKDWSKDWNQVKLPKLQSQQSEEEQKIKYQGEQDDIRQESTLEKLNWNIRNRYNKLTNESQRSPLLSQGIFMFTITKMLKLINQNEK